jgi:hypothetical protein
VETTARIGYRRLAIIVVGGVVFGWLAFLSTAGPPIGPGRGEPHNCHTIREGGFDPWTGLGFGRVYECVRVNADAGNAIETVVAQDPAPRTRYGTRHALPVWLAMPVGWIILAWLSRLQAEGAYDGWSWRPRRSGIVLIAVGIFLLFVAFVGMSVTLSAT